MRILAVSHSCAAEVNQELFTEIVAQPDTDVLLVMPRTWRSEYTGRRFSTTVRRSTARLSVLQLPVIRPGHVWQHAYIGLARTDIARFDPHIVYSTQEPWSLANEQFRRLAKRRAAPFVFHTNQNLLKRLPAPFRQFERASYRDCTFALAYSEGARRVMTEKGLRRPSAVVPYGTNVDHFHPGMEPALREALGVGSSVVLGYVGRLVPEKGVDLLIRATAALHRSGRDVRALVVGEGAESGRLRSLATQLGIGTRVQFTGPVAHEDAAIRMRCIDILVLPSRTTRRWKEQFGRVLIEAWATQIPVVGSTSGEIPHFVKAAGGGLIFREDDTNDLVARLGELVDDTEARREFGARGGATVRAQYTFSAVAARLRELFDQVTNQTR